MTALLYKQLRLVCHPMTPVFCLFGVMVLIPNYPYTVIFFYVTLGLFFTFLNMREQKDIYYSALLPVPKRDTVKAGCLFTVLIELLSLVLLAPFAALAVHLQPGKDNLVGLDPQRGAAGRRISAVRRVQRRVPAVVLQKRLQGGRVVSEGRDPHGGGHDRVRGAAPLPGAGLAGRS